MVKSLSIIGMGSSLSSYLQDFESAGHRRPTDEVWAINSAMYWLSPRLLTHGIAMDSFWRDERMDDGKWKQYVANMRECSLPVYTDTADPDWPNLIEYPLAEVISDIWPGAKRMEDVIPDLENTINFALALGISREFDEISLYGCDFRLHDRQSLLFQRADELEKIKPWWFVFHDRDIVKGRRDMEQGEPCTMFLLGVAHQRGIKVSIPHGSTLCNMDRTRYVYGYQTAPDVFKENPNE